MNLICYLEIEIFIEHIFLPLKGASPNNDD